MMKNNNAHHLHMSTLFPKYSQEILATIDETFCFKRKKGPKQKKKEQTDEKKKTGKKQKKR